MTATQAQIEAFDRLFITLQELTTTGQVEWERLGADGERDKRRPIQLTLSLAVLEIDGRVIVAAHGDTQRASSKVSHELACAAVAQVTAAENAETEALIAETTAKCEEEIRRLRGLLK